MSEKLILVAEDNDLNRDMLTRRLVRRGHRVVTAVNGEEALLVAAESRPDLILMDLSMPGMDGWEATRRLKQDPELWLIPVVALTGHAISTERTRAMEAGCDEVVTKPFDFEELLLVVDELTG